MEGQSAVVRNRSVETALSGATATIFCRDVYKVTRPVGVELFCGVGGMTLGFEQAGFDVVAAFDSDPLSVEYHKKNFGETSSLEHDVAKLSAEYIKESANLNDRTVDVLFGGPPCQGFSEIGQRRDGDSRNLLILEFARLVGELKPSYFVVETVRGLLYSYSKPMLDSVLERVDSVGYTVAAPIQVLDASKFGVPQKRRRAFLLGFKKGLPAPGYPTPLACEGNLLAHPTVADAIGDLPKLDEYNDLLTSDVFDGELGAPSEYAKILRGEAIDPADLAQSRERAQAGLSGCLRTIHREETVKRFQETTPGTYEAKSRCYRLKENGTAYTLRAGTPPAYGSFTAARPIHPTQPRCITTREAARLHSFPDWFEFHPTKWHGFRQIGNAVPPLLARAVALVIKQAIEESKGSTVD
jgi:DNA (cytosine-5)-methyltransferase 1